LSYLALLENFLSLRVNNWESTMNGNEKLGLHMEWGTLPGLLPISVGTHLISFSQQPPQSVLFFLFVSAISNSLFIKKEKKTILLQLLTD
jgi:hypothetical protein